MNSTDVNLATIISAIGPSIFSFLPLGSLLNGLRSPALVSKTFHDSIFISIGDREVLDFSQCAHLRKITDDSLSTLVMKVVRLTVARRPAGIDARENHTRLKVVHLDISNCRKIQGGCLQTCLEVMTRVKRLSIASCSKFDPIKAGLLDWICSDTCDLQYLDVSCCAKLNVHQGQLRQQHLERLRSLRLSRATTVSSITAVSRISHLNLSGVSSTFDDDALVLMVTYLPKLESLDVSGAKKLTAVSFGFVTWFRRSTLKRLNLTGCTKMGLGYLLSSEGWKILSLINDSQRAIPPNMVKEHNPLVDSAQYVHELRGAMNEMVEGHIDGLHIGSSAFVNRIKDMELPFGCYSQESNVEWFGMLEDLSIEFAERQSHRGCIAIVAWLNAGRLRKFKASSVGPVSINDVSVLLRLCPDLRALDLSNLSVSHVRSRGPDLPQLRWGPRLRELDLSCSQNVLNDGDVSFLGSLFSLRSLILNCLEFVEDGLHDYLSKTTSLLRLSIWNCSTVKCSKLSTAIAGNNHLKLLDLDAREIDMDCPLSFLRHACSSVLILNNRKTETGLARMRDHIQSERWRVGSRNLTTSPTAGHKHSREISDEHGQTHHIEQTQSSSKFDTCTLSCTGFSTKPDTQQQFFTCATCSISFGRVICSACAKNCHAEHETVSAGYICGYCDCSILSECQCLEL